MPIALFVHKQTQELHPRTQELIEEVAKRVEKGSIEAWFDLDARELLGDDAETYEKVTDVMDVWADSGLTHECVHHTHPDDVKPPVDLYLEGSDQHRGWFHSSLLMSEALYARAPYKGVLTHGFTVDDKGRKMSKSLGNVILPQKVMSSLGADVMRLWIAATDYANEMGVSDEILKRISDSYRRMRNTVRFLLGNLAGFDPAADALPVEQMVAIDRWALARTAALHEEVVEAYRKYEYHLIYQKIHNFCVVDLGGFYLDILKDRLYTTPKQSIARRSAQTALYHIAESMVRWLAPDPQLHLRGDLELHAGQARGVRVLRDVASVARRRRRRRTRSTGTRSSHSRPRLARSSRSCASPAPSAHRSMPRSKCSARTNSSSGSSPSVRSCASCSSFRMRR